MYYYGKIEAFVLGNTLWPSFLDAIGNAVGYGWILLAVAFFRELFGSGKLFGYQVFPDGWYEAGGGFYLNNNLMILPPMALIVVGLIIWVQRSKFVPRRIVRRKLIMEELANIFIKGVFIEKYDFRVFSWCIHI